MDISEQGARKKTTDSHSTGFDWPIILFFAIAYLIAWGMIPILASIARQSNIDDWRMLSQMAETLNFGSVDLLTPKWIVYFITRLQDFSFSIAGVMMIAYVHGRAGLRELGQRLMHWQVSWRWWMVALLPFGLYGIATVVNGAVGSFEINGHILFTIIFSAEAGLLVTLFLRGPMGEELGLRGFALPRLQARMSSFQASIIIGIFWAAWHLPVLLGRDIVSIIAFLLLAFVLSFIFTWLFNGSGGSLLPVLLFHALQNTEEVFETIFPSLIGTDWELISTLILLIVGIIVGIILWRQTQTPFASGGSHEPQY